MSITQSIGRRKTAIARIYLEKGKGKITINKKDYKTYFPSPTLQYKVLQALSLTDSLTKFDIKATVLGGGPSGQVEAFRLALAKALCNINEKHRAALKPKGLLTRDSRMVERKKPGLKKARKRTQFSKR